MPLVLVLLLVFNCGVASFFAACLWFLGPTARKNFGGSQRIHTSDPTMFVLFSSSGYFGNRWQRYLLVLLIGDLDQFDVQAQRL